MILHILALYTNTKCTWGCASGGILSVRHIAGPAEGPGKILKYRCNLRQNPVNFSNKLCILIFIYILSIWLNFFDPLLYYRKLFGPPFRQLKTFWPPPFCPAPPHQSIYEHSLTTSVVIETRYFTLALLGRTHKTHLSVVFLRDSIKWGEMLMVTLKFVGKSLQTFRDMSAIFIGHIALNDTFFSN